MKSKKHYWTDYDSLFMPINPKTNVPKLEHFMSMLLDSLQYNQGIIHEGDYKSLLKKLLPSETDTILDVESDQAKKRLAGILILFPSLMLLDNLIRLF